MSRETFPLRPLLRGSRITMTFMCVFVTWPLFSFGQEKLHGGSFESAGTPIHFEVIGEGARSPIIVINGGPGFSHTYLHLSEVWEELARDGPVVFYDQRGTGRSQQLSQRGTSTLQDNIDDLRSICLAMRRRMDGVHRAADATRARVGGPGELGSAPGSKPRAATGQRPLLDFPRSLRNRQTWRLAQLCQ